MSKIKDTLQDFDVSNATIEIAEKKYEHAKQFIQTEYERNEIRLPDESINPNPLD